MLQRKTKNNDTQTQVVCVNLGVFVALDSVVTAVNSNSEHVSLFHFNFAQTDLQVTAVTSKPLLDRLRAIHEESLNPDLKQMQIKRHLNRESVDRKSSKTDEKCKETYSFDAATDIIIRTTLIDCGLY